MENIIFFASDYFVVFQMHPFCIADINATGIAFPFYQIVPDGNLLVQISMGRVAGLYDDRDAGRTGLTAGSCARMVTSSSVVEADL